ncbi:MAG TPA: hypothetical protein VJW23_14285 [Propionibacteriaceae bacterium]|nr:hypothetical protein [Propionibacteriaceae bacterium]
MAVIDDVVLAVRDALVSMEGSSVNEQTVEGNTQFNVQVGSSTVNVNVGSGSAEADA